MLGLLSHAQHLQWSSYHKYSKVQHNLIQIQDVNTAEAQI